MGAIDPSARIASGAVIGKDVEIGPYCVVGPRVTLGDGCRLVAHVSIMGQTAVGARTVIYPFASLGCGMFPAGSQLTAAEPDLRA